MQWPLLNALMQPGGLTSTSNIVTGQVSLEGQTRGVLVTLPVASVAEVIASLADPDAARA